MTDDPWYGRSEFWVKIGTVLLGVLAAANVHLPPIVRDVGATAAAAAPIVYIWGRGNVKAAAAGAALAGVGAVLTSAATAKPG